jgi:hypothetical protein
MKKLYCSPHFTVVQQLKEMLGGEGIACVVQNRNLAGTAGELPPSECWAELWVVEDGMYESAMTALTRILSEAERNESKEPWRCPRCGEDLAGQFNECWRCGASREES